MSATKQNLTIEKGATFSQVITWTDESGDPIDLSNYSARMQIRPAAGEILICSLSTELGNILLGGPSGTVTLALSAVATAMLPSGYYRYDLELVTGNTVYRLLEGVVQINSEITV